MARVHPNNAPASKVLGDTSSSIQITSDLEEVNEANIEVASESKVEQKESENSAEAELEPAVREWHYLV